MYERPISKYLMVFIYLSKKTQTMCIFYGIKPSKVNGPMLAYFHIPLYILTKAR